MTDYYGAKCHRCSCLRHDGDQASEPLSWLQHEGMECADCSFCQNAALSRAIQRHGWDLFAPEVRAATKALLNGQPPPNDVVDRLRAEIQAIDLVSPVTCRGRTMSAAERIVWCDADLSDDGLYRYRLTRRWGTELEPRICWIMLNPSTADAIEDDPTIRRCIRFSEAWGFGSLIVVNLFALRSTDPKGLLAPDVDPIGPGNDHAIRLASLEATCCMAAWGTKGGYRHRNADVIRLVTDDCMETMHALALTKDGHPKHPLYVKGDTKPVLYRAPVQETGEQA